MTRLLDCYAARKRKWQEDAAQKADTAPDQAAGSSRPATGCSSEEQAIIISGSLETGSNDGLSHRGRCPVGGHFDTVRASNDPSFCSSWEPARQVLVYRYRVEEAAASRPDNDEFLSPC